MNRLASHLGWIIFAVIGASALGYIALNRGETINALWLIVASVSVYLIAYRYYSLFVADKVLGLDKTRKTPAWRHNDGLDYVPTNKYVLFGHHFAAIAGRPTGWPSAGRTDGLPARNAVDSGRGRSGRGRSGLYGAVRFHAPRRSLAG